jgi:hypothetical protein
VIETAIIVKNSAVRRMDIICFYSQVKTVRGGCHCHCEPFGIESCSWWPVVGADQVAKRAILPTEYFDYVNNDVEYPKM